MGESHEAGRSAAAPVPGPGRDDGRRPRWSGPTLAAGVLLLAALGGGAWWRRRRKRIALQPMSDDWLREREYGAGQRSVED